MVEDSLTKEQVTAIKCAHADLIGALQAFDQNDINVHDWNRHGESIQELQEAFSFLDEYDTDKEV